MNLRVQAWAKSPPLGRYSPPIGRLFRSEKHEKNETEVIIMVTPHIIEGVD